MKNNPVTAFKTSEDQAEYLKGMIEKASKRPETPDSIRALRCLATLQGREIGGICGVLFEARKGPVRTAAAGRLKQLHDDMLEIDLRTGYEDEVFQERQRAKSRFAWFFRVWRRFQRWVVEANERP